MDEQLDLFLNQLSEERPAGCGLSASLGCRFPPRTIVLLLPLTLFKQSKVKHYQMRLGGSYIRPLGKDNEPQKEKAMRERTENKSFNWMGICHLERWAASKIGSRIRNEKNINLPKLNLATLHLNMKYAVHYLCPCRVVLHIVSSLPSFYFSHFSVVKTPSISYLITFLSPWIWVRI